MTENPFGDGKKRDSTIYILFHSLITHLKTFVYYLFSLPIELNYTLHPPGAHYTWGTRLVIGSYPYYVSLLLLLCIGGSLAGTYYLFIISFFVCLVSLLIILLTKHVITSIFISLFTLCIWMTFLHPLHSNIFVVHYLFICL